MDFEEAFGFSFNLGFNFFHSEFPKSQFQFLRFDFDDR